MGSCHERMDGTREVGSLVHSVQLHARIAQQPGLAGGYGVAVPTQMGYTGAFEMKLRGIVVLSLSTGGGGANGAT